MKIKMIKSPDRWVLCPICGNKTRTKIRPDTILENFPLFCPKCKQETLISAKDLNVAVIPQQIAESRERQTKVLSLPSHYGNEN